MPKCCVPNCKNTPEGGFLLRCFPRNEILRSEWARNINKPGWIPNHSHRICEVHFEPHMWEKTRVDGTRKLKFNAVPTIFKTKTVSTNMKIAPALAKEKNEIDVTKKETPIIKILPPANVKNAIPIIPPAKIKNEIDVTKKEAPIIKILPPINSKNAKPIILPASIFENQSNSPSTIVVNTEGKIINTQPMTSVSKPTSILKSQIKSTNVSSAPMIIATNASSSMLKSQIKSASNQSPIVIPAKASILKPQFHITPQQISTQLPNTIQSKSANNQSVLIPMNSSVQKLDNQRANLQPTLTTASTKIAPKIKIEKVSEPMSMEEFNDVDEGIVPVGIFKIKAEDRMKKIADDRFEKMDKLLLKQLKLNNALRKRLASVNHRLHQQTKEKSNDFKEYLKDIFTEDQMRVIELRYTNPKSISAWSYKTMIKAIKLKECCGTRGYEELLRQNMPLPSIRTISRWCTQRNIPIP